MANRGDLLIIEFTHSSYVQGEGRRETTSFQVGVVTSITREGAVKAYRRCDDLLSPHPVQFDRLLGLKKYWVQPKASINVEAALATAKAHQWPGRETRTYDHTMEYPSLEAVQEALRPHVIEGAK